MKWCAWPPPKTGGERYRHKKQGGTYQVIGVASSQVVGEPIGEGSLAVVYRSEKDGSLWVRPHDEFYDGRFERIEGPQTGGGMKCAIYSQVPPYRVRCEPCLAAGRCIEFDKAPQTGGGDAEWVCAVLYRVTEYLAKTGTFAEDDIAALRKALAMLDALHNGPKGAQTGGGDAGERARAEELINELLDYCPSRLPGPNHELDIERVMFFLRSSHREGAEAITDDMNAAHWHGYREGAEAMREDAANLASNHVGRDRSYDLVAAILTLPISERKTDAE